MKLCFILICSALVSIETKIVHKETVLSLCSETEAEDMNGLDGEERFYADFQKGVTLLMLPDFADPVALPPGTYENSVANIEVCKKNLDFFVKGYKYPAEPMDPPQNSIYSKDDVQLGSRNTLICYITRFYPPHVGVSWTRNDVNVTNESSISQYSFNDDGTFTLVSSLSFTPEEGDIYTCTVKHTALERPLTKTWDVQVTRPSVGPSVFCGVGVAAALLGITVGTFFIVKRHN